MKLSEKIAILKRKLNHNYSSFAQTLDSTSKGTSIYDNDYVCAIVDAIRYLGKELPLWKKSILIPIEADKRYYATYINLYTKDAIDLTGITQLGVITYSTDDTAYVVGELGTVPYEAIERNQYIDVYYWGQKFYGDHFTLKSSSLLEVDTTGSLNDINGTPSATSLTATSSIAANSIVYNLEFAEKLINWYTTATTTGTTVTCSDNVQANGWADNDKLWVSSGLCSFMNLTFTAIPQINYFASLTTSSLEVEIPIMGQYIDDIDDICLNYLYHILMQRDPDRINTYAGLMKTGMIKSNDEVKRSVMGRISTMEPIIIDSYNYKNQRYGR